MKRAPLPSAAELTPESFPLGFVKFQLGFRSVTLDPRLNRALSKIAEHIPLTQKPRVLPKLSCALIRRFHRVSCAAVPKGTPGRLRRREVHVVIRRGRYRFAYLPPPWKSVERLLKRAVRFLNGPAFVGPPRATERERAVLRALYAHLYINAIHPFTDGNGRTSRLVEFFLLTSAGMSIADAFVLRALYREQRLAHLQSLNSTAELADPTPLLTFALPRLARKLDAGLDRPRRAQNF